MDDNSCSQDKLSDVANMDVTEATSPNIVSNPVSLYTVIRETIIGKRPIDSLVSEFNDLCTNQTDTNEFFGTLADILVQCEIETSQCDLASQEQRDILIELIQTLVKTGVLPESIAKERFDIEKLEQTKIAQEKPFKTAYNRTRTRLYYKQKKYILLREENEGFAKIITALSMLDSKNQQDILSTVIEIIGAYKVDPNRVLDLILDVFEYNNRTNPDDYVEFIHLFFDSPKRITQIINLKLSFYASAHEEQKVVPPSFYRLIAILIQKRILDLEEIYPILSPHDAKILDYHKKLVEEGRAAAKRYSMAMVGDEKPAKQTVFDSLSDEDRLSLEIDNQKVHICAHLIDVGDWEQALMLARKLPEFFCFSNRWVAKSTCDLINYIIDPIYRECALPKPLSLKIRKIADRHDGGPKQIKTLEELPTNLFPMLTALGPFISADPLLLTKIIRLLRYCLLHNQDPSNLEANLYYYPILDVINESILPSMTLTNGNTCLARELWSLLKHLKYHIRYKLYFNWKDEGSNPIMLKHRGQILLRAKHHMKRLSKDTLRTTGRHLGKLCYSNPVITLNYVLLQIQSYDNLITLVVDALRYLPPISMDILIYCIIESLSDPHKTKKSADGMALAQWLTSISNFSSNIILRYKVEFTSFLEYIAHQLRSGNSLDLVLLTDLIQKMTGIETIQAITDDRIEALMGGDVLRTEGAYFGQVKNTRKPSARLKDALIESRLAMPLCISMAQLRDSLFFNLQDGTAPLKLVGKLYDQCQETLVQYGVFLSMNLSIDDYINFLPPLDELMTKHKLDPDSAFFLARPMIFHKIKSKFYELKQAAIKEIPVEEEGEASELSKSVLSEKFIEAARSVINPLAEVIQPSLIEKYSANNLNSKLFVIFWTLSMSDIEVPVNCYDREIQRLKTTVAELGKSSDDDMKRRKERERCNDLIQKLKFEQSEQIEHVNHIRKYMESEKSTLFCDRLEVDHVYYESRQFVQHCPFARSILTASDAIYSARFLLYLHELKVENYPTIICLDRLLCDLTYMIGACTENEANHYGRFLCHILKTAAYWHSDASVYAEKFEHFPGSIIHNPDGPERLSYDKYQDICYKWHYRLTRAFSVALESQNYIQIRNALVVMIAIIEHYPAIKHFGKGIGMKIEDVRSKEKENRHDLYALATAYAGRLDEKRPTLMPESNFHHVPDKKKKEDTTNSKSSNPQKTEPSQQASTVATTTNSTSAGESINNGSSNNNAGAYSSHNNSTSSAASDHNTSRSSSNHHHHHTSRSSSSSRPSSKTRPASSPSSHRERHSSSSSRKRARYS